MDIVDRLIVDSSEWDELRYEELGGLFGRTAVSDIAWARTDEWRRELADRWPAIREPGDPDPRPACGGGAAARVAERAPRPGASGRSTRPGRSAVRLGGEELPAPRGDAATPSDLLSAELDNFSRDRIYEAAVLAAAGT